VVDAALDDDVVVLVGMVVDVGDVENQFLIVEQVQRDAALFERLEQQLFFRADAAIEDADSQPGAPDARTLRVGVASRADIVAAPATTATNTAPAIKSRVRMTISYCWPPLVVDGFTRLSGRIAVLMRAGRAPVLIFATIASFFRSIASV